MQHINKVYEKSLKGLTYTLLFLFGLHFLSVHGFVDDLVYCFEENGQINIESEAGSIFTIPSEKVVHAEDQHNHERPAIDSVKDSHHDMSLSLVCSKEQQTTRFDQERTLKFLDGILYSKVENLPQSRVFQLISFIPPLIENVIITSLQTVVLIN